MSTKIRDIVRAVRAGQSSLVGETIGYLVLGAADSALHQPGIATVDSLGISVDGNVELASSDTSEGLAEASIRALLGQLLIYARTRVPSLERIAERPESRGLESLVGELEAALVPVNRRASKRSLSRLARDAERYVKSAPSSGEVIGESLFVAAREPWSERVAALTSPVLAFSPDPPTLCPPEALTVPLPTEALTVPLPPEALTVPLPPEALTVPRNRVSFPAPSPSPIPPRILSPSPPPFPSPMPPILSPSPMPRAVEAQDPEFLVPSLLPPPVRAAVEALAVAPVAPVASENSPSKEHDSVYFGERDVLVALHSLRPSAENSETWADEEDILTELFAATTVVPAPERADESFFGEAEAPEPLTVPRHDALPVFFDDGFDFDPSSEPVSSSGFAGSVELISSPVAEADEPSRVVSFRAAQPRVETDVVWPTPRSPEATDDGPGFFGFDEPSPAPTSVGPEIPRAPSTLRDRDAFLAPVSGGERAPESTLDGGPLLSLAPTTPRRKSDISELLGQLPREERPSVELILSLQSLSGLRADETLRSS